MIDSKVSNAITGTSAAQSCFIFSATSKDFHNIDEIFKREVKEK